MSVKLRWATPNIEQVIADLARVSAPENEGKDASQLLSFLIRNNHWSPFEMANICLEINTTRDIARQILRHRSFSFQEFSQRYAEVSKLENSKLKEARLQDHKNRQNSLDIGMQNILHEQWKKKQELILDYTRSAYNWAISNGLAKEVARVVLPEGLTMSKIYMNGTVRSWIHYLNLRLDLSTQKEHREIAQEIFNTIKELFPVSYSELMKE